MILQVTWCSMVPGRMLSPTFRAWDSMFQRGRLSPTSCRKSRPRKIRRYESMALIPYMLLRQSIYPNIVSLLHCDGSLAHTCEWFLCTPAEQLVLLHAYRSDLLAGQGCKIKKTFTTLSALLDNLLQRLSFFSLVGSHHGTVWLLSLLGTCNTASLC